MEAQFSYPHAPESSCVRATFSDSAMFPSEFMKLRWKDCTQPLVISEVSFATIHITTH